MRTAVLIAAAAALSLSACNRPDDAATDASTEAAEASGVAVDTAGTMTAGEGESSASGSTAGAGRTRSGAGATSSSTSGETMDPAAGGRVSGGAMTPGAQPGDTAGNNVTETERRLNPPTAQ